MSQERVDNSDGRQGSFAIMRPQKVDAERQYPKVQESRCKARIRQEIAQGKECLPPEVKLPPSENFCEDRKESAPDDGLTMSRRARRHVNAAVGRGRARDQDAPVGLTAGADVARNLLPGRARRQRPARW